MRHRTLTCTTIVLGLALSAHADTRYVAPCGDDAWSGLSDVCEAPDGPKATVQAALDASLSGDEIVLLDGTYAGAGNTDVSTDGKSLTIRSANGRDVTTLDGEGSNGIFLIDQGETVTIEGLTMANGRALMGGAALIDGQSAATFRDCAFRDNFATGADGFPWNGGGALSVQLGSTAEIDACDFTGNTSDRIGGGGLFGYAAAVSISDSTFEGNDTLSSNGGAVYVRSGAEGQPASAAIERSSFRHNAALFTGGAIALRSVTDSHVADCVLEENRAQDGGGLGSDAAILVTGTRFEGNVAEKSGNGAVGGAIIFFLPTAAASVDRCWLVANSAEFGAGIFVQSAAVTITNSMFLGNATAAGPFGEGGAGFMDWNGAASTVVNSTFVGNETAGPGGAWVANLNADTTFANCITWGNLAAEGPEGWAGDYMGGDPPSTVTISYSDVQGGPDSIHIDEGSTLVWGDGNIDADPLFVDPDGDDYRLGAGSPAIDGADNAALPDGIEEDLGGAPRHANDPCSLDTGNADDANGHVVDMGAYEYQSPCPADTDCSGAVDFDDLLAVLSAWGTEGGDADINGDGSVDFDDLLLVLNAWGPCD